MSTPVSETLLKAKAYIEERGWWQFNPVEMSTPTRKLCISTAIQLACNVDINGAFEYQRFCDAMKAVRETVGGQDPVRWNDSPERTLEQVLTALDAAAARAA